MYAKNKNDDDDVLKCILTYGRGVGPALKLPHNMEKKKIPHTKENMTEDFSQKALV